MNQYQNGIAIDTRSPEKKNLDYRQEDLAGAVILNWKEKAQSEWKMFTPREQDGSLSCCGQSAAKAIQTMINEIESAHPIYRSRSNFPEGGMYLQNLGVICVKNGTTTETQDKSQFQNETTMNRDITTTTPTKVGGYVFCNPKDIESIAEAVALNKHCILIFHCNKMEWNAIPKYNGLEVNFGHCVCAVDYLLKDGVKYLLIEDSTGHFNSFDKNGQRLISADFLKARCDGAMYLTPIVPKPKYVFTKTLRIGDVGNHVKMLQLRLNIGADGLFGMRTKQAVIAFQIKHQLQPDGIVGRLTNIVLNL